MLYLKIIDTFLKNNIYTSYIRLSTKLKNSIEILVDQAVLVFKELKNGIKILVDQTALVFKLRIKTVRCLDQ